MGRRHVPSLPLYRRVTEAVKHFTGGSLLTQHVLALMAIYRYLGREEGEASDIKVIPGG